MWTIPSEGTIAVALILAGILYLVISTPIGRHAHKSNSKAHMMAGQQEGSSSLTGIKNEAVGTAIEKVRFRDERYRASVRAC